MVKLSEQISTEESEIPQTLYDDKPENILIEGKFGSGKSGAGVSLLNQMVTECTHVYSNSRLRPENFDAPFEYQLIPVISYNHLLSFKRDSIAYISEIHKLFDRRESMSKKNILATQSIQEIRKCAYKIISDCETAILLDFRYLRTTTDIIRAYGNISHIIDDRLIKQIPQSVLINMYAHLNEKNYKFYFLYQMEKYDASCDEVIPQGQWFILDIRDAFDKYYTHERIQKSSSMLNYI